MTTFGPPSKGKPARRKLGTILLKLAGGALIIWLIARQLSLDDKVTMLDGSVRSGSGLVFDRASCFLRVVREDGAIERIPLSDDPSLFRSDSATTFSRHGATKRGAKEASFEGIVALKVEGARTEIPLAGVRLRKGPETDGAFELFPEVSEGLRTIFGRLTLRRSGTAFLLILVTYLLGIRRWQILLGALEISVSFWEALRLTMIGFFLTNVVPGGIAGGDALKAFMIARAHRGRGALAVSTVIVDRVLGLVVLAALSAVFLAFNFNAYPKVALWLFLMFGAGIVGILLFLSRRVRKTVRLGRFLSKLPKADKLRELDEALLLFRSRHRVLVLSVVLSVASHLVNIFTIYLMGKDLGVDESGGIQGNPILTYFAIVPTILIASWIPLLPGGWGVGEWAYAFFFRTVGVANLSLSVGLSVLTRASMLAWSLVGGVFLLLHRTEARDALHDAEAPRKGD